MLSSLEKEVNELKELQPKIRNYKQHNETLAIKRSIPSITILHKTSQGIKVQNKTRSTSIQFHDVSFKDKYRFLSVTRDHAHDDFPKNDNFYNFSFKATNPVEEVFFQDKIFRNIKPHDEIQPSVIDHLKYLIKDASFNMIDKGIERIINVSSKFGQNETSKIKEQQPFNQIMQKLKETRFNPENPVSNIQFEKFFFKQKMKSKQIDRFNDPNFKQVHLWPSSFLRMVQKEDKQDKDAWKKLLPDLYKDIRSDELKQKKYYTAGSKVNNFASELFKGKGDQTSLNDFNLGLQNPLVPVAQDQINGWVKLHTATIKILNTDLASLNSTRPQLTPLVEDYKILIGFGVSTTRLANKLIRTAMKTLAMMEDKQLSLFKFVDNAYKFDIVFGVSMPLPDLFKVTDSGDTSQWKLTKQGVSPHKQAYTQSNKLNKMKKSLYYQSIVNTRFQRSQDGEFHLSFRKGQKKGKFGILFRQSDPFVNYSIEFNFKKHTVAAIRRDPFHGNRTVLIHHKRLHPFFWQRAVVRFNKTKITLWLQKELRVGSGKLNKKRRKKEKSSKPLFSVQDAGQVSGGLGWYCVRCKNMQVDDIQLQQSKCKLKDESALKYKIASPTTFRYSEKYTSSNLSMVQKEVQMAKSKEFSEWEQTKSNSGRTGAISQKSKHWDQALLRSNAPSTVIQLRDPSQICFTHCFFNLDQSIQSDINGLLSLMLKYKDMQNYIAITVKRNKSSAKVTILQRQEQKFFKLGQQINKNLVLEPKMWQSIRVMILNDSLDMWLRIPKLGWVRLYSNFRSPQLLKVNGTAGLGTNHLVVNFDRFLVKSKADKVFEKKKDQNQKINIQLQDSKDKKQIHYEQNSIAIKFQDCTKATTFDMRNDQCTKQLSAFEFSRSHNIKACITSFCPLCCGYTVTGVLQGTCKASCEAGTVHSMIEVSKLDVCLKNGYMFGNQQIKLMSCLGCCSLLKTPIVDNRSITHCQNQCYNKYRKQKTSLSQDQFDNYLK